MRVVTRGGEAANAFKRIPLIFSFVLFLHTLTPLGVLADSSSNASLLGPTVSDQSGGASTGTLSTLQPASPNSLQTTGSTNASQSTDQSALQQTATDQSKLFVQGDGDINSADTSTSGSSLGYEAAIFATLILVTILVVLLAKYDLNRSAPISLVNQVPPTKSARKKKRRSAKS